jgi:hypothetical protein
LRFLRRAARHGEDQRHRHVGGVLGQHARRVGHRDAALEVAASTSILSTPLPKLAISFSVGRPGEHRRVDPVGHGRHQHVGRLDRLGQLACVIGDRRD